MKTLTAVEAASLAAAALALEAVLLLQLVARPLGSALRGYEEIAAERAQRASEMPRFGGESIEVRGTRPSRRG